MERQIRILPFCALVTAVFLFAANSTLGQVSTATLEGTVVDQQKAAVAGATVTARESATGLERSAQTNSDGSYTITNLPAGKYNVAVEAKGFARSIVKDLALEVGRVADADFTLSVAGTAEKVVVSE